ncbi:C40 family peptidase [Sphaerisporangium perillae]|uniref:C40 family peptidase n=1 Tax=Sphaerisporangium perillae TaxID=2935860 RepID=UPI00200EA22A|nr:C40 family peptidase [Sphaerisporangium perillae]
MLVTTVLVTGAALSGGAGEGVPGPHLSRCAQVRRLPGAEVERGVPRWSDTALRRWLGTVPAKLPEELIRRWSSAISAPDSPIKALLELAPVVAVCEDTGRAGPRRPSSHDLSPTSSQPISPHPSSEDRWSPHHQVDPYGTPGARVWTWPAHDFETGQGPRREDDEAPVRIHQPATVTGPERRPETSSEVRHHADDHASQTDHQEPVGQVPEERRAQPHRRGATGSAPQARSGAPSTGTGSEANGGRKRSRTGAGRPASGRNRGQEASDQSASGANDRQGRSGQAVSGTSDGKARSGTHSGQAVSGTAGRKARSGTQSGQAGSGAIAASAALRQLGTPYVWGGGSQAGATGGGFDCSGLALYAWGRAGVSLPHYTGSQFAKGTKIPFSQLQAGDLVFFGGGNGDPTHVGVYLKDGVMVHAPKTGDVVRKVDFAHSTYYRARYRGAIRPGK